jgi:aminoglycoside 6'-N-acetyltransferase I
MSYAEKWALSLGYNELASDTEIENEQSISIHSHLGFKEIERIVCFLKRLDNA